MSGKGYIKIDRKIDDWEYRHDMPRLGFWLHLLLSAEWKRPGRGTLITSRRELECRTNLDRRTIAKYLSELEELDQIKTETAGRSTKITILKYNDYQGIQPRAKCTSDAGEMHQSEKLPRAKCTSDAGEMHQSESTLSLFNRTNEEIECINNKNTYTGECVDVEILDDAEIWFREFWKVYPKHKAKAAAEKAFRKACTSADEFQKIMDGLNRTVNQDWQRINPQYIPYPATWLNGRRWEDERDPETETSGNVYIDIFTDLMKQEGREE